MRVRRVIYCLATVNRGACGARWQMLLFDILATAFWAASAALVVPAPAAQSFEASWVGSTDRGNLDSLPFLREAEFVPLGRSVPIPRGYYDLCMSDFDFCRPTPSNFDQTSDGAVRLTPPLVDDLKAENSAV